MNQHTSPNSIDFSAIPQLSTPKKQTVLGSLLLSIGMFIGILLALGLTALFSNDSNRENAVGIVGGLMFLLFLFIILRVAFSVFKRFGRERRALAEFAEDNGWFFDGKRQKIDDDFRSLFDHDPSLDHRSFQRFIMRTNRKGSQFILAGFAIFRSRASRSLPSVVMVLKINHAPDHETPSDFSTVRKTDGLYIISSRALSRDFLRDLFKYAKLI